MELQHPPTTTTTDSPASASSSTLVITDSFLKLEHLISSTSAMTTPNPTGTIKPSPPKLSLTTTTTTTPSNLSRMSSRGFVEPHKNHLPRRTRQKHVLAEIKVDMDVEKGLGDADGVVRPMTAPLPVPIRIDDSTSTSTIEHATPRHVSQHAPVSAPVPIPVPVPVKASATSPAPSQNPTSTSTLISTPTLIPISTPKHASSTPISSVFTGAHAASLMAAGFLGGGTPRTNTLSPALAENGSPGMGVSVYGYGYGNVPYSAPVVVREDGGVGLGLVGVEAEKGMENGLDKDKETETEKGMERGGKEMQRELESAMNAMTMKGDDKGVGLTRRVSFSMAPSPNLKNVKRFSDHNPLRESQSHIQPSHQTQNNTQPQNQFPTPSVLALSQHIHNWTPPPIGLDRRTPRAKGAVGPGWGNVPRRGVVRDGSPLRGREGSPLRVREGSPLRNESPIRGAVRRNESPVRAKSRLRDGVVDDEMRGRDGGEKTEVRGRSVGKRARRRSGVSEGRDIIAGEGGEDTEGEEDEDGMSNVEVVDGEIVHPHSVIDSDDDSGDIGDEDEDVDVDVEGYDDNDLSYRGRTRNATGGFNGDGISKVGVGSGDTIGQVVDDDSFAHQFQEFKIWCARGDVGVWVGVMKKGEKGSENEKENDELGVVLRVREVEELKPAVEEGVKENVKDEANEEVEAIQQELVKDEVVVTETQETITSARLRTRSKSMLESRPKALKARSKSNPRAKSKARSKSTVRSKSKTRIKVNRYRWVVKDKWRIELPQPVSSSASSPPSGVAKDNINTDATVNDEANPSLNLNLHANVDGNPDNRHHDEGDIIPTLGDRYRVGVPCLRSEDVRRAVEVLVGWWGGMGGGSNVDIDGVGGDVNAAGEMSGDAATTSEGAGMTRRRRLEIIVPDERREDGICVALCFMLTVLRGWGVEQGGGAPDNVKEVKQQEAKESVEAHKEEGEDGVKMEDDVEVGLEVEDTFPREVTQPVRDLWFRLVDGCGEVDVEGEAEVDEPADVQVKDERVDNDKGENNVCDTGDPFKADPNNPFKVYTTTSNIFKADHKTINVFEDDEDEDEGDVTPIAPVMLTDLPVPFTARVHRRSMRMMRVEGMGGVGLREGDGVEGMQGCDKERGVDGEDGNLVDLIVDIPVGQVVSNSAILDGSTSTLAIPEESTLTVAIIDESTPTQAPAPIDTPIPIPNPEPNISPPLCVPDISTPMVTSTPAPSTTPALFEPTTVASTPAPAPVPYAAVVAATPPPMMRSIPITTVPTITEMPIPDTTPTPGPTRTCILPLLPRPESKPVDQSLLGTSPEAGVLSSRTPVLPSTPVLPMTSRPLQLPQRTPLQPPQRTPLQPPQRTPLQPPRRTTQALQPPQRIPRTPLIPLLVARKRMDTPLREEWMGVLSADGMDYVEGVWRDVVGML